MLRAHLLVLFLATLLDSALGGWEAEIDPFSTKLGGYREYDLSDAEREHDLMIHGVRNVSCRMRHRLSIPLPAPGRKKKCWFGGFVRNSNK